MARTLVRSGMAALALLLPGSAALAAETPAGPAAAPADKPAPLFAPPVPGGLTADEVAKRAVATSHEGKARAEEAASAESLADQTAAAYIPRLSGVARYTRLSGIDQPVLGTLVAVPPGTPPGLIPAGTPLVAAPLSFPVILDQYTTQATLQVPLTDYFYRLPRLHDAAKGNARSAALMATATRARVGSDARIAYYNWVRARLQSDVAARSLAQAKAHLKDVEAANASGASSRADVLRVASQVATAELAVTRTRTAIEVTQRRVATFMHDSAARSWDVGEDVGSVPPPSPRLSQPVPQLVGEAMTNRPELKALLEAAGAARANAGAALAATLPRIDAVGNATYARPNGRIFPQEDKFKGTWDASVQLTWAPTDVFGGQSGRAAALAKARQLEEDRAALADGIELEVAQSLASLRESEAAMATSERGLIAAAEGYRVRRALYQNGRATSVELTDSEIEHARAELEAIASRIDRRIAEVRLAHALGEDARQ